MVTLTIARRSRYRTSQAWVASLRCGLGWVLSCRTEERATMAAKYMSSGRCEKSLRHEHQAILDVNEIDSSLLSSINHKIPASMSGSPRGIQIPNSLTQW
jgi:hypothetical protein